MLRKGDAHQDGVQEASMHMRSSLTVLVLFSGLILVGCSESQKEEAQHQPGKVPEAGEISTPALTGILSEEEFKALHELRSDHPPVAQGEMIDLAGGKAYLSLPEGNPPHAGIVVIHEWWGLNENIKHWSDRLAADGYAALAVDLYEGRVADNRDSSMAYMRSVRDDRAHQILQAAHDFLAEDPRVRAPMRGCIGWCFGGGWSLQHALNTPDLDAAVIYYGQLVTDPEVLGRMNAHLLAIFANQDQGIPPSQVDAFESGLESAGIPHSIHRYDAEHAFANPSSGRYKEEAAAAAWDEVRLFLTNHLKSGGLHEPASSHSD
jgi:carboxymethylenebutenolidase